MAQMSHMHPDLMGAAGFEPTAYQARNRRRAEASLHLIMRHRLARIGTMSDAHLLARYAMPADRRSDGAALAFRCPPHYRQIDAFAAPVAAVSGELPGGTLMACIGLRRHQDHRR